MVLGDVELDALARSLVAQRQAGSNVRLPSDTRLTQREIYEVQDRVTRLLGSGLSPSLFKVSWLPLGLVNSPEEQPCFAGVPAGRIYGNNVTIDSRNHPRRLGFEVEIACRLAVDNTGQATPAVAILGIEVVEEHSDDINKDTISALLAAGMFNHGYVLGYEILGWPDVRSMEARIWRNDALILHSTIGEQFDPDVRLEHFLAHARTIGWPINDGMIVSLGALNKDVWAAPGDRFSGEIEAFGRVSAAVG